MKTRGRTRRFVVDSDEDFKADEVEDEDDDKVEEVEEEVVEVRAKRRGRRIETVVHISDDDNGKKEGFEEEVVEVKASKSGRFRERERRKRYEMVDDDDNEEVVEVVREKDLVRKALFKCARISKELRKELYGSKGGLMGYDRYAEVEDSSVRIVTQIRISTLVYVVDSINVLV